MNTYEITVKDVEYQRVGDRPMLARVYRPEGAGPFPTFLEVHGGAWVNHDRLNDAKLHEALATRGVLVVAVDFRQPPEAGYPASLCDLNLAIRWLKVNAPEFGGLPKVGAGGISSGGHQSLLCGMRPRDPRYSALPLEGHPEVDASLAYVLALWPPSDPLYRYQVAKREGFNHLVSAHDAYWVTEEAMAEGSPPLILERGEPVELPPVLVIQRTVDVNHPLEMQQRLVHWYRERGGIMEMPLYENLPGRYSYDPASPDTVRVTEAMLEFIDRFGR